jgi:hypothetical protein
MNYDAVLAVGLDRIQAVREFSDVFPDAEHTVVKAKRDFHPNGWQIVHEWISRSPLFDRYIIWLVVAIDVDADDSLTELEKPAVYVTEVDKAEGYGDDDEGPSWQIGMVEFEDGDWEKLVEERGDFAAIDLDLTTDVPVHQFAAYWRDTRPAPLAEPPEQGMAFKAPLRFMMQ